MVDTPQVARFTDGEGYDRFMGRWSRAAGHLFLDGCRSLANSNGLMSAAAPAHSRRLFSGYPELPKSERLILPQHRSHMRNRAKALKAPGSKSPTPALCLLKMGASMLQYPL